MSTLTVTKDYLDGTDLFEADLDAIISSLETYFNTTKLDAANIQSDSITTSKIATSAVTAAKIASATVDTNNIADAAVTTIKIADDAITTAKILDGAVDETAINDAAVTVAKLEAVNEDLSSASSTTTTKTANITTSGKRVIISLTNDSAAATYLEGFGSTTSSAFFGESWGVTVVCKRDSTTIGTMTFKLENEVSSSSTREQIWMPGSSFRFTDQPDAGTYTYSLEITADSAKSIKMHVYEIY